MLEIREKILEFVKNKGPILPVQISKNIGGNLLFSSAILSELVSAKKLRISNARIGSSPLYYYPGQESKLNMLYNYLPNREKEVYNLLKSKLILKDSQMQPVYRVALRNLRDFAVPLKVNFDGNSEIFWKWYLLADDKANRIIQRIINPQASLVREKPSKKVEQTKKTEIKEVGEFIKDVNLFFTRNNFRVIASELIKKNKEIEYIIEVPSSLGMLKFFVKAKDKKRISDNDLTLAQSKTKLPVLFLSKGELTKKAEKYIENTGVVYKKISL